jgi:phosphoribosylformimino-5-aminoimidazole carboxamide ribotide isomerase
MDIIPSLFIQRGKAVSLYKGNDNAEKKIYHKAPHSYVEHFAKQGAKKILIVDLDGNQEARLLLFREHFSGAIWWAGQVRTLEKLEWLFKHGADRVVLGQAAKPIYEEAIAKFGAEKLLMGIQIKKGEEAADLCEQANHYGFTDILVKDLNAEGTLFQPDFDVIEKCLYFSGVRVYASGGITDHSHLRTMNRLGVTGVVIGRALMENQMSLSQIVEGF